METCVRGFSYRPEKISIQLVENEELERTWRSRRRQLLKEQEERIYKEFIKETDVVEVVSKDDPYQFLQQLPEACIQELLEEELHKTRKELQLEKVNESLNEAEPPKEENQLASHVTFAEDTDREDGEMFRVYDTDDNDNEKEEEPSGISEDNYEDFCETSSNSPVTVRERDSRNTSPTLYERKHGQYEKQSESVSAVIESSIYCAKVKDLRMKVRDEIDAIIASLDRHDVMRIEQEQVTRQSRRSAEFSSRFNRIYMYQLKRQIEDLKRNNQNPLPFAKHTHFHAQMVRIASLHHNLLQALQVFHKSIEQTSCLRDSATVLHALALTLRTATSHCASVPAPRDMKQAAAALYNDGILEACDNLDETLCGHSLRISEALSSAGVESQVISRKAKPKKKPCSPTKNGPSKSNTDTRLSMYSMDTVCVHPSVKTFSKYSVSGISKLRGLAGAGAVNKKTPSTSKSPKRTPRSSRRPLMRAGKNPPRLRAHLPKDTEISTMVEAVEMQSSFMSHSASPPASAREDTPRTHQLSNFTSPRKPRTVTNSAWNQLSPKQRVRHSPQQLIKALRLIQGKEDRSMNPVSKINCSEREPPNKLDKIKKNDKIKPIANPRDNKNKARPNSGFYIKEVDSARSCKDTHSPRSHQIDSKSFVKEVNDKSARQNVHGHADMLKELDPNKPLSSSPSTSGTKDVVDGADSYRSDERRAFRMGPAREVSRLLKQLCSGDSSGENISGPKNAQLHFVNGSSPRPPPSTPQLLKILETTIKKKLPKPWFGATGAPTGARDPARHRMQFNLSDRTTDSHFQYRTMFVQHMLESSLYANSAVGKPWEVICSVSDKLIDEILLQCASDMQLKDLIGDLYQSETK